jgi:hypothetical protein
MSPYTGVDQVSGGVHIPEHYNTQIYLISIELSIGSPGKMGNLARNRCKNLIEKKRLQ